MARKEVRHVLRDPFTLALALGLPLFMTAFFGWVMELDVREIRIMVEDRDRSRASRQLADAFSASGFFRVSPAPAGVPVSRLLDGERTRAVLVVEPGFGRDLARGRDGRAQVLLDGADNSTVGAIMSYIAGVESVATGRLAQGSAAPPVTLATRFLFNGELNSRWFLVPGIMVVVMSILAVLLTALTVAREWETGSMELLLSTPVRPLEVIVGKLGPYLALCLTAVAFVYVMARVFLGVPFVGSHLFFLGACLLFLVPALAQGLLISVVARSQTVAVQIGLVSSLLPSMMLSGFVFPIESMPLFFRVLTYAMPQRWFMQVIRGIFLRGAGPVELVGPLLAMTVLGAVLVSASVRRFKADLEP